MPITNKREAVQCVIPANEYFIAKVVAVQDEIDVTICIYILRNHSEHA